MRKTLLTLAAGLLCLSASAAESAPYSYTFDNANFNTDGGWTAQSFTFRAKDTYRWSSLKSGVGARGVFTDKDAWLVSPAIQLEAGKTYNVEYTCGLLATYIDRINIYCATASDFEALKGGTAVVSASSFVGTGLAVEADFKKVSGTITPTEDGTYYFGLWDNTESSAAYGNFLVTEFKVALAAAGTMPGKPTDFTAVADEYGALKVALEATVPSVDASGNTLTGNVTLEFLRGETVIKTFENLEPGMMVSFTDNDAVAGASSYSVRAVNSDGTSEAVSAIVNVGLDIPDVLKSFTAIQTTPGTVKFVWEKPDADIKGTTIRDKSLVKVKILAYDDTDALVKTFENLEGDNATLQVVEAAGDQKFYTFRAYAVTAAGESLMIETKGVAIGTPSALPYCEDFKGGVATQPLYMSNYETFRAYWDIYTVTDMVTFEDKDIARFTTSGYGSVASIYSGLINIPADAEAEWTLEYAASSSTATGHTLILLINDGEGWAEVETYDINSSAYNQAKVDLSSYAGKTIQYGVRVKGSSYGGVNIANINIKNTKETPSGIESIVTDEQEGEAIYYDLMGRRVANPSTGVIYIKVVNGKATRVLYR